MAGTRRTPAQVDPLPERQSAPWPPRRLLLLAAIVYAAVCLYFLAVQITGSRTGSLNDAVNYIFPPIYLGAAVLALRKLRHPRAGSPRLVRTMLLVLILALFSDFLGSLGWIGYALRGIDLPYPSVADVAYVLEDVLWIVGIGIYFWILDTNIRDELGPFVDLLAVTWSLTILLISYIEGISQTSGNLLKLMLDIFYPFTSALMCALTGCLLFGPQFRRLNLQWRWVIALMYVGFLITFFGDFGFSITTSLTKQSPSYQYFYYDGNLLDFLYATAAILLGLAVVLLPLETAPVSVPHSMNPE